jgi:hypothetical protein
MNIPKWSAIALGSILLYMSCSMDRFAGGTGEETTNGRVSGVVVFSNGNPAPGAHVKLIPEQYDPFRDTVAIPLDTTDNSGRFAFTGVSYGTYTIQSTQSNTGTKAIAFGIVIAHDNIPVELMTLQKPGAINVELPSGIDTTNGFVYVPGTDIAEFLNGASTSITVDSVPAGILPSINYLTKNGKASTVIRYDVRVNPGDTITIVNPEWEYSRVLTLNTTTSGAGVTGNVYGFPVLIRLTSSNFNFSQSSRDGADIRFTKQDNTPLSYEIERWDSANGQAEIWLKVDTVYGNDSSHYVNIYWGNPNATNGSSSLAVFDTADGNVGVWHLGPGLSDATQNTDNGIDSATADAPGIIGRCRHFDPNQRSFITIPNEARFDLTTRFTLSVWVQVDTFTLAWQTIIDKGDNAYRLHRNGVLNDACFSLTTLDSTNFGYYSLGGTTSINDHSWHLVCGVFDGAKMQLYVDGKMENDSSVNFPCGTNDLNLTIGDNRVRTLLNTPRFFDGSIDEVRVMRTAENADWIKLCFMNQMENDKLIIFK